jgi:23S rRNA (uracil1939-C5)-methyltransferase
MTGETMVNLVTTDERPEEMRAYTEFLLSRFPAITTVVNNITDRMSMVAQGDRETVWNGPGTIREMLGKYAYRVSANSFFQTNTVQAAALFDTVVAMAAFSPDDVVYDLYCGDGSDRAVHLGTRRAGRGHRGARVGRRRRGAQRR